MHRLAPVLRQYGLLGDFIHAMPVTAGHINDTYVVTLSQAGTRCRYICQRINHHVFKRPEEVMENIRRVLAHLRLKCQQDPQCPIEPSRRVLHLIPTLDGEDFSRDEHGNWWRLFLFIESAHVYHVMENPNQARLAAKAFGEFQRGLVDLPGARLHETIPDFHHTSKRFNHLVESVNRDIKNRCSIAGEEIEFAFRREEQSRRIVQLLESGEIPERITHNDTKLNNVLIDDASHEAICVIDLDTTMPGCALYDFGDMVRTAANSAAEDEQNTGLIKFQLNIFEALLEGYLASAGDFLNQAELENLAFSGRLLTYECGMRFLKDYLDGDQYFRIHYPEHNLVRARAQFALLREMEKASEEMEKKVLKVSQKLANGANLKEEIQVR